MILLSLQLDTLCVFTNATLSSRHMIECQKVVNSGLKGKILFSWHIITLTRVLLQPPLLLVRAAATRSRIAISSANNRACTSSEFFFFLPKKNNFETFRVQNYHYSKLNTFGEWIECGLIKNILINFFHVIVIINLINFYLFVYIYTFTNIGGHVG